MNILDKNYDLFSSVRVLHFFTISSLHFLLSVQSTCSWGHHLAVMPVSIIKWRAEIGIFHTRFSRVSNWRFALLLYNYWSIAFHFVCCMALTLFICGNVELNPASKNTQSYYFSLFHWNLKSLPAHAFSKLSLMEAYSTNHKFNMICLSETYLDSSDADDLTQRTSPWLEQINFIVLRDVELIFILKNIWVFAL